MHFTPVDPRDIPNLRDSRRGRVSYPILKSFLETGELAAKLETAGVQQTKQSLMSSLTAYCRNHKLPIRLVSRGGDLFLVRLDVNPDTNELDPNWTPETHYTTEGHAATEADIPAAEITPEEVNKRFAKEEKNFTK